MRKNLRTVDFLDHLAKSKGCTPAQLAIARILSQGDDIVPVVGISRRSRLPESLGALDLALSADELTALDRAFHPGAIVDGQP